MLGAKEESWTRKGREGEITKGQKTAAGGARCVPFPDRRGGFTGVCGCQNLPNHFGPGWCGSVD